MLTEREKQIVTFCVANGIVGTLNRMADYARFNTENIMEALNIFDGTGVPDKLIERGNAVDEELRKECAEHVREMFDEFEKGGKEENAE